MLNTFLTPESYPFAIALAVTAGLFILEIISSLLGATVLGLGGDAPDIDVDADFDLSSDQGHYYRRSVNLRGDSNHHHDCTDVFSCCTLLYLFDSFPAVWVCFNTR